VKHIGFIQLDRPKRRSIHQIPVTVKQEDKTEATYKNIFEYIDCLKQKGTILLSVVEVYEDMEDTPKSGWTPPKKEGRYTPFSAETHTSFERTSW